MALGWVGQEGIVRELVVSMVGLCKTLVFSIQSILKGLGCYIGSSTGIQEHSRQRQNDRITVTSQFLRLIRLCETCVLCPGEY